MEVLLHYIYVVALKDAKAWQGLGPGELAVVGFWNLIIVWLKVSPIQRTLVSSSECTSPH